MMFSHKKIFSSHLLWNLLLLLTLLFIKQDAAAIFTEINSPFKSKIIKIQQDEMGFIWIATDSSIQRYDGYQFETLNLNHIEPDTATVLTDFFITNNDVMYIATANKGLLEFFISTQNQPSQSKLISDQVIYAIVQDKQSLWVATDKNLYHINQNELSQFEYPENKMLVSNMIKNGDQGLLFSAINSLYSFNFSNNTYAKIDFNDNPNQSYIWDLVQSNDSGVLVSTDDGLFYGRHDLSNWQPIKSGNLTHRIRTLAVSDNRIWLGSIKNGLATYQSQNPQLVEGYQNFDTTNSDLKNNEINQLFLDQEGSLWVGFYSGKINLLSKQALAFGHNSGTQINPNCVKSSQFIYHFSQDQNQNLWITTQDGIIKINEQNSSCHVFSLPKTNTLNQAAIPLFTFITDEGHVWAYFYRLGFIRLSQDQQPIAEETLELTRTDLGIYELIKQEENIWVFATSSGVMAYDTLKHTFTPVLTTAEDMGGAIIKDVFEQRSHLSFLATSRGLATYDSNEQMVSSLESINEQLSTQSLNAVYIDTLNNLWLGASQSGLYQFNENQELIKHYNTDPKFKAHKNISNIIEDDHQNLWVTTDNGLLKLSLNSKLVNVYKSTDGLQEDSFNPGAVYKTAAGKIYLGGLNGFNAFMPDQINNHTLSGVAISELKRFNQPIHPNTDYEGFKINQDIAYLNELTLSHNDYVIGFELTDFNFLNSQNSQFAYKLSGFDPDWNYVDSNNRTATYTNLPDGQYTFEAKGRNQAGEWSQNNKSIAIQVNPPPWLSWWALSSYALLLLASIYQYVRWKTKTNQRVAKMLRIEVTNKTRELNVQKKTVESLLVKKNELFSNVSHEFRTPLTLILGPIKELLAKHVDEQDLGSLKMINRNANRLLSLVEQLLQIARVSDLEQVKTTPQNTQKQVQALVDSFQYMAKSKRIQLHLLNNDQATIDVTDQLIDAVLGNLISNAIKYTPAGGQVDVKASVDRGSLCLSVKDNGTGLTPEQQKDIFKRFKRLDSHQAIEGIGIGLSVVEELVKVNDGLIEVDSEPGAGSEFIVRIPLAKALEVDQETVISSLVNQLQRESEQPDTTTAVHTTANTLAKQNLNTVLVIEDNHDMRAHIIEIVSPHYNCISAENGVKGVATAIEEIPDIIISDVMMPEMDGFKVARIIRSDQRTSHIPLMLLTALNDKTSRIKGWRENVDAYMTKPFDRDELLVQLENMLTIRDILKRKAGQQDLTNDEQTSILPKKDQQFIDKLKEVIESNYQDPILNRGKIASQMAVSDRQLQRKVSALIDQNPMDMLREFRLNKAKELLKDGYQVSQIADDCGFNSLSYFSQCFKAQFGLSPKQYQNKVNNK